MWHPDTFDDVEIEKFIVIGLSGMLPLLEALQKLGQRGLEGLAILNDGTASLEKNTFQNFSDLSELSISNADLTPDNIALRRCI